MKDDPIDDVLTAYISNHSITIRNAHLECLRETRHEPAADLTFSTEPELSELAKRHARLSVISIVEHHRRIARQSERIVKYFEKHADRIIDGVKIKAPATQPKHE